MELASIDAGLRTDALEDVWSYAVGATSKQTRTKVLLSAEAAARGKGGEPDTRLDVAAAAVELVHLATLQHDDVIDDSGIRRGLASVPARFGAPLAAAAGGLFCGRALTLFARCGQEAVVIAMETAEHLCEGQMLELRDQYNLDRTPARCLKAAKGKTASTFRMAAELGALLGDADEPARRRLRQYGLALGVGFQFIDDVLNLTGDEWQLGKPCGNDLENGNYTLPVIYALEEHPKLGSLLRDGASPDGVVEQILKTEAIARTSIEARAWISKAQDAVRDLPEAEGLLTIADAELGRLSAPV